MLVKKIVFRQPGRVEVSTASESLQVDRPTEVVIKNHFSLISAGTELACLGGNESWFNLPNTPGYAAVGEVVGLGTAVSKVALGDLVLTHGPHAEFFRIDTTDRYTGMCVKVPAGLRGDLAVFARIASIALTSLRVARIELGDRVLVAGMGLVGNLAAQFAALQGAMVLAVDPSGVRRAKAMACGLEHAVDSSSEGWKEEARQIAGPGGWNAFIDATGLAEVIGEASALLAPHGEAVLLGTPRSACVTNVTEIYRRIHLHSAVQFHGALEWLFPTFKTEFAKHSIERNTEIILGLLVEGALQVAPLYTHKVRPEQAAEVYDGLRDRKDDFIGVVFDWT